MNEESLQYRGWRVATASGVGVFFATLFVFTFAVLLRALVKEFEWSREAISSAYGAMTLASAFAAPVMGQLVDQWGPRWIVGPSLMLGAAAFGSLSVLTPHLWHLYLVYLVLGVAVSGTSPVVYSRVISSWFDRRRGTALAVMVASAGVGAIVHPPPSNA